MIRKGCSLAFLFSMALLFSSWFWKQDSSGALNQFNSKASRMIEKKYKVRTCATGGSVVGGVSKINLHFECDRVPDVNLARQYLVGIVEDIYHLANTDKQLRPFLKDQHISREYLEIRVLFDSCFNKSLSLNLSSIAFVNANEGRVDYNSYNCETDRFKLEHRESYEEARKIVLGEEVADQGSSSSL